MTLDILKLKFFAASFSWLVQNIFFTVAGKSPTSGKQGSRLSHRKGSSAAGGVPGAETAAMTKNRHSSAYVATTPISGEIIHLISHLDVTSIYHPLLTLTLLLFSPNLSVPCFSKHTLSSNQKKVALDHNINTSRNSPLSNNCSTSPTKLHPHILLSPIRPKAEVKGWGVASSNNNCSSGAAEVNNNRRMTSANKEGCVTVY